jgi:hypothetical protein
MRIAPGSTRPEAPRPCFVAFTWATSTDGEILSRAAGTFTTVDEARQYLGRVRAIWLDEQDRWAVFKLPAETGRGALVAAGVGGDLSGRRQRADEHEQSLNTHEII